VGDDRSDRFFFVVEESAPLGSDFQSLEQCCGDEQSPPFSGKNCPRWVEFTTYFWSPPHHWANVAPMDQPPQLCPRKWVSGALGARAVWWNNIAQLAAVSNNFHLSSGNAAA
jgi:hypothetical protein